MAKRPMSDAISCPLGCGELLPAGAEHVCHVGLVEDDDHQHDFTTSTCSCGLTVEEAILLAAEETTGPDVPAASTACLLCDAPITEEERRTSGTCADCLSEGAATVARPATVQVAPSATDENGVPLVQYWHGIPVPGDYVEWRGFMVPPGALEDLERAV